jgi:predicted ATPase
MLARQSPFRMESSGSILAEDGSDLPNLVDRLSSQSRRKLALRVASIIDGIQSVRVVRRAGLRWIIMRERMKSRGGNKSFDLPAWMLSEGTRRLVAIFTLLELDPPPSLIAIEEVENGLDPWTLETVLDALRDAAATGIQIILTTHSPFLLDHVEPQQVIHVRRSRGDTTYESAASFDEIAKYEGVLAPGAMYLSKLFEPKK